MPAVWGCAYCESGPADERWAVAMEVYSWKNHQWSVFHCNAWLPSLVYGIIVVLCYMLLAHKKWMIIIHHCAWIPFFTRFFEHCSGLSSAYENCRLSVELPSGNQTWKRTYPSFLDDFRSNPPWSMASAGCSQPTFDFPPEGNSINHHSSLIIIIDDC